MKTFTTLRGVLIGTFVSLVLVDMPSTGASSVLRDRLSVVADSAGESVQTADNAGGDVQAA